MQTTDSELARKFDEPGVHSEKRGSVKFNKDSQTYSIVYEGTSFSQNVFLDLGLSGIKESRLESPLPKGQLIPEGMDFIKKGSMGSSFLIKAAALERVLGMQQGRTQGAEGQ